jgi:hypothetical protein
MNDVKKKSVAETTKPEKVAATETLPMVQKAVGTQKAAE